MQASLVEIIHAEGVCKKATAWRRYKNQPSHRNLLACRRLRKSVCRIRKILRRNNEETLAKRARFKPKAYYRYVQTRKLLRKDVWELTDEAGRPYFEGSEKAKLLKELFQKVHRIGDGKRNPDIREREGLHLMQPVQITCSKITTVIMRLIKDKSPGPDGIHAAVLKPIVHLIANPLQKLFSQSLNEGKCLQDWKSANVVAIHKGGPKKKANNYRPVSLTSLVVRIMERIIKVEIYAYQVNA